MKKNIENKITLAGKLFSFDLKRTTVTKQGDNFGKEFIRGEINIQTDEEGLNVVPVYYTFITEFFSKSGKPDSRFPILAEIIEKEPSVEKVGPDAAMKLSISGSFNVNDFYDINNTKEIVSQTRIENAWLNKLNVLPTEQEKVNEFSVDALLNGIRVIEEDPENGVDQTYAEIKGATFGYKNALIPITFTLRDPEGIDFMVGAEISSSNPMFTQVWGTVRNSTIKIPHTVESAWGPQKVTYTYKKEREWLISGLNGTGYGFGDETSITEEELTEILQARQIRLAEVQKNREDYEQNNNKNSGATHMPGIAVAKKANFNF